MTEDQIERHVEHTIDRLDAQFMDNRITEHQYNAGVLNITRWASRQYGINQNFVMSDPFEGSNDMNSDYFHC
jgi:hypothetical protein